MQRWGGTGLPRLNSSGVQIESNMNQRLPYLVDAFALYIPFFPILAAFLGPK